MEAGEYILRLNHPLDDESSDFLVSITRPVVEEVCSRLVERSLTRRPGSFGPSLMGQLDAVRDHLEAKDSSRVSLRVLPLLSVCRRFCGDFADLYRGGISSLSGENPVSLEDLSDFFADPLTDRVWLRNKRERKVHG